MLSPPLQLSVYHLPTAGIHCPIYMCGTYPHANYIYSRLPSMLSHLSPDMLATAVVHLPCGTAKLMHLQFIDNQQVITKN